MQGCDGPAVNAGLYRPCTMGRAVQDLHYMQGFAGLSLFVGLYRHCTIRRAL